MFFIYDFLHEKFLTSLIIIIYSFFDSCTITYLYNLFKDKTFILINNLTIMITLKNSERIIICKSFFIYEIAII